MNHNNSNATFYSLRSLLFTTAISLSYLLLSYVLVGFKTEQLVLIALFNGCYFALPSTRKFITGFSIFIVFWILFDYMKAFPNYWYNTVHIKSLYDAEKFLFGINVNGIKLTPNEFWLLHKTTFLDVLTGFFYLCWVPVPLAFAGYLFYKNRAQFLQFSLTFLLVNIIGFMGYYIYPAAPPWYIQQYGFNFIATTPGNTAGMQHFDDFFKVHIFQGLYAKSSNVFAAMPSLHAAYMAIVLYYGVKNKFGPINMLFATIMAGIWFSAVYSSHHYLLDVLAGILCAAAGIIFFQKMLASVAWVERAFEKFLLQII